MDYESLQLKFLYDGHLTTLQGEKDRLLHTNQLHQLKQMMHIDAIAQIYNMEIMQSDTPIALLELPNTIKPKLALLLHTYNTILSTSNGLSPSKSMVHSIPLLEGSNHIKVRPHYYPHN